MTSLILALALLIDPRITPEGAPPLPDGRSCADVCSSSSCCSLCVTYANTAANARNPAWLVDQTRKNMETCEANEAARESPPPPPQQVATTPTPEGPPAWEVAPAQPPTPSDEDYRVAWSASLCAWTEMKTYALSEIAREKRLAKIGGVLDVGRVAYWQRIVGAVEDHDYSIVTALRAKGLKPLPCNQPLVARAAACVRVRRGLDEAWVLSAWSQDEDCQSADLAGVREARGE